MYLEGICRLLVELSLNSWFEGYPGAKGEPVSYFPVLHWIRNFRVYLDFLGPKAYLEYTEKKDLQVSTLEKFLNHVQLIKTFENADKILTYLHF
jgi:hypothetical protein